MEFIFQHKHFNQIGLELCLSVCAVMYSLTHSHLIRRLNNSAPVSIYSSLASSTALLAILSLSLTSPKAYLFGSHENRVLQPKTTEGFTLCPVHTVTQTHSWPVHQSQLVRGLASLATHRQAPKFDHKIYISLQCKLFSSLTGMIG